MWVKNKKQPLATRLGQKKQKGELDPVKKNILGWVNIYLY